MIFCVFLFILMFIAQFFLQKIFFFYLFNFFFHLLLSMLQVGESQRCSMELCSVVSTSKMRLFVGKVYDLHLLINSIVGFAEILDLSLIK